MHLSAKIARVDLKCDAPECDYAEAAAFPPSADLIGKPCPKCGANLLTAEDHAAALAMFQQFEAMNAASEAATAEYEKRGLPVSRVILDEVSINPRASGTTFDLTGKGKRAKD